MTTNPTIDPEVERDPVAVQDLEGAARYVLFSPGEDRPKSEKRTPTREGLDRRWKLTRRDEG